MMFVAGSSLMYILIKIMDCSVTYYLKLHKAIYLYYLMQNLT